jgi:protein-disulfide isomerase
VKSHARSLRAAEAAEAAAAQGKFWEMHDLLYLHPDKLSDRYLRTCAREIGLDHARFDREMLSRTYADQILKDYYNSITNGITGAPTTFINRVFCPMSGAELIAAIKAIVEDQSVRQERTSRSVMVHLWRTCFDLSSH